MKNECTSRVAQSCETESPPRYTFREEQIERSMALLVDYFPFGFEIAPWAGNLVEVIGFEMADQVPQALAEAIGDRFDTPEDVFWGWVNSGKVLVPFEWLEIIQPDDAYDDWHVTDEAWALAYGKQGVEVAAA